MLMNASTQEILNDAQWLAHRYDRVNDLIQFRYIERAQHGEIPFLTDEYIGDAPLAAIKRPAAAAAAGTSGNVNFLFHSAFCASTMLVRALDRPGVSMGLSEPVILNDIVGFRRRGEFQPAQIAQALTDALALLSRPYGTDEAVIIKPSNILNTLAGAMMAIRPDSKALFLYAPLPVFLASVARKGMWCRLWARELLEGFLQEGVVNLGFEPGDYFRMTDLQVAAVGWLAQHAIFSDLAHRFGRERIRTLSSETLLANRRAAMADLAEHLQLNASPVSPSEDHGAFTRHSKTGEYFDADHRQEEQEAARAVHGEEIEKVTSWAEAVARNVGLNLELPHAITAT